MRTITWSVPADAEGCTVKKFLSQYKDVSRRVWKKIDNPYLQLNGEAGRGNDYLSAGDLLQIKIPPGNIPPHFKESLEPMDVLYEDEDVIVVNKPPGLPTLPGRAEGEESLAGRLAGYLRNKGMQSAVHPVSRLDRGTSGIVPFALHAYAHSRMEKHMDTGSKEYIGVVEGEWPEELTSINLPLRPSTMSLIEQVAAPDGKRAVTSAAVLELLPEHTVLKLGLQTGRTHQIRVHTSASGFPLAGDTLYGNKDGYMKRQALHACRLEFFHPVQERMITITAPLPEDMSDFLAYQRLKVFK
ncbi:pseudouridine synthase [Marinococcus halophilus]|uniref:Pseudouridine synthase n=1 Tax=Marinococcus halophilus TaxID=1371 RepID=A0A510Y7K5_MARHA|nr:RluA family pseudouridine synthase [Marinococcus halophilus]OZT79538.1 pseudouridine synthase [Marinococcus halophilus]GEK59153.1 putative RNA pseudouridine synthase YjbO [Marinococcus halophilus]